MTPALLLFSWKWIRYVFPCLLTYEFKGEDWWVGNAFFLHTFSSLYFILPIWFHSRVRDWRPDNARIRSFKGFHKGRWREWSCCAISWHCLQSTWSFPGTMSEDRGLTFTMLMPILCWNGSVSISVDVSAIWNSPLSSADWIRFLKAKQPLHWGAQLRFHFGSYHRRTVRHKASDKPEEFPTMTGRPPSNATLKQKLWGFREPNTCISLSSY